LTPKFARPKGAATSSSPKWTPSTRGNWRCNRFSPRARRALRRILPPHAGFSRNSARSGPSSFPHHYNRRAAAAILPVRRNPDTPPCWLSVRGGGILARTCRVPVR
jgi:hypothetical protein